MLFNGDVFSPELVSDSRVRSVLTAMAEQANARISPGDVLAAAIGQGDAEVLNALSAAIRSGHTPRDVAALADGCGSPEGPAVGAELVRRRASFTPQALAALEEFDQLMLEDKPRANDAGLETLLICVLKHMDRRERRRWAALNVERAVAALAKRIEGNAETMVHGAQATGEKRNMEGNEGSEKRDRFLLPPEVGLSHDLTHDAKVGDMPAPAPFDGEPHFEALFDMVVRVLHRRRCNHVLLVGERGVGKNTVLSELARRAAMGTIPFLQDRNFLLVDCRYIAPDESRPRLVAILEIKHTKSNRPVFAPEFLARIRRIIVFQPLDRDAMEGICHNLVRDMQQSWQEKREKRLNMSIGRLGNPQNQRLGKLSCCAQLLLRANNR